MGKIKLLVALLPLLATLLISTPASALLQFRGNTNLGFLSIDNTHEFVFGTNHLLCAETSIGYESSETPSTKMKLGPIYGGCTLERSGGEKEAATVEEVNNCQWELKIAGLTETSAEHWGGGTATLTKGLGTESCEPRIHSTKCEFIFFEGSYKEYKWTNLHAIPKDYESELIFALSGISYEHIGKGCGTGTGGEYKGTVKIKNIVIL
jgi:hypothetical protein